MTDQTPGRSGLDYLPCLYGQSKVLFRGPRRRLIAPYASYLGGTETYGRFVPRPFPALVEDALALRSVNLGCLNAGIDLYLRDESLLEIARKGAVTVIEVSGAHLNSNRFYAVHPRRNDRFLHASPLLQTIYPEIDYTEFHFTRHMLTRLREASEAKFFMVQQELQDAWIARMRTLIERVGGRVILLWMSRHAPDAAGQDLAAPSEPLFVTRAMVDAVAEGADALVEIVATPGEIGDGKDGLMFGPEDAAAAEEMLGTCVHARAAAVLGDLLSGTR
ncbi:DUF6473 family protein [Anianabacter salinae]|uniref:DUF6473 family protein n=1 Tax=Anianabacter salinae TaxID=2851023 RepID=UPI00225E08F6|nr:DUF6473 family protein [Anianabacter salinae]MBV0913186.1 hypothetical protein [Anianabacter salinae]